MVRIGFLLAISFIFLGSFSFGQESGQKLYRIYPVDNGQIKNIEEKGINVYNSSVDNYIDVVASPDQIKLLNIDEDRIEFLANNFKELVDSRLKTGSYQEYHDHQETISLLNDFASMFPHLTVLDTIGFSRLGREICSLKISDNPETDEDETPILMVGNHHGNEVLSVEATLYQIDFLLNNYGVDQEVTNWIDNMEIWYVPLVNPDGREAINRYNDNGIDLNRNYSFAHTAGGSHGPSGFSEPETQAIRDLAAKYPPVMSLTYHTSGRLVLLPWTHTDESAPDSLALAYLGNKIAESIIFPSGAGTDHYELRQGGDWYFTAGEYCDYMYATHNTHAYTIEMWTSQTPPSDVIPQVVERNLEGMKTLFRQSGMAGVTGRVTDRQTGLPLVATIGFPFIDNQGKLPERLTDGRFGRYYKYLQPGTYNIEISAPGYRSIEQEVLISADSLTTLDLEMDPSPSLKLKSVIVSDVSGNRISGNGDGLINIGETIGVLLSLYNDQEINAEGCKVKISSNSPYLNLITDSLYFGAIAHYSEIHSTDTMLFNLSPDCPDGEDIEFLLDIGDETSFAWKGSFTLEAITPSLQINEIIINDAEGNQNGVIDNGESVTIEVKLENRGRQNINDVIISFTSEDPYFNLQTEYVEFLKIDKNETARLQFDVELDSQTPDIYSAYVSMAVSSKESYEAQFNVPLNNIFGFFDDFENGINEWSHASYGTTSNNHDDWQLGLPQGKSGDPTSAFSGSNCWGTDLGHELFLGENWNGEYQNNVYNYLQSPVIDCSNMIEVGLRYRRWLNTRAMDIGSILVNDNLVWKSSNRGHSDQEWVEELIDISEFADGNPEVSIKFELRTNSSNALGGWNIDDVVVANKLSTGNVSTELQIVNPDLIACYPNPFSQSTQVHYSLNNTGIVDISIYNALGKKVKTLISESKESGAHSITWNATNDRGYKVENGLYFVRLETTSRIISKRLMLINN